MAEKTNIHVIRTPEGIVFSQQLAGPVARFAAWIIDAGVMFMGFVVMGMILGVLRIIGPGILNAVSILAYFAITIGYGMFFEWVWRGQTIGKRILRLRVVDAAGLRLQFNQIAMRNLLRFVDSLPYFYLVGGVACVLTRKCQRLGDLAANTIVVRYPRVFEPDLEQLLAGKFNSLRQYPHLEARLRQRISPAEAAVLLQALLRRDEFEPAARVELFHELAEYFQAKAAFPPEATDGITDEQYVRNVTDVLYRTRTGKKMEKAKEAKLTVSGPI
jgi:uncharacterized RDD family membrane protein YckC